MKGDSTLELDLLHDVLTLLQKRTNAICVCSGVCLRQPSVGQF